MVGLVAEEPAATPDPACADIQVRLAKDRAGLQATAEWQAVEKTVAYNKFMLTLNVTRASGCFRDATPGPICSRLLTQFRNDWDALKATPEYQAAAETDAYTTLKADYADARDHHCFSIPALERPAGSDPVAPPVAP
jgi:hypothetical protein